MKPIYKSLALAAMTLSVSLALQAQVNDGESVTENAVQASSLDGLKVELVSPNVTGARDLIASGECVIDGANLTISLNAGKWIKGATYSVRVSAVFGTQTVVLYVLNVTVPRYEALADETQEWEDTIVVVSTFGDGDKSGADATVYAKDGDGNAKITTPLSIGIAENGASIIASGAGATASGNVDGEGATIQASGNGAIASGYANGEGASIRADADGATANGSAENGASIRADADGATANGYATGDGAYIVADSEGTTANGYATGENSYISAGGSGAVASGCTEGDGSYISASSNGAVASGCAMGDGSYINAGSDGSVASGCAMGDGSYINAGSDGSVASGRTTGENSYIAASGEGAVARGCANGDGSYIAASGEGAVASGFAEDDSLVASGRASQAFGRANEASGNYSHAEGNNTRASGYASHTEGQDTTASGDNSHAGGLGTIASHANQHVCGKYNVDDTDGDYALIVGNGTANNVRSNAFAIDWNGNLVLFNAGTPVVLTPAKLATLIA